MHTGGHQCTSPCKSSEACRLFKKPTADWNKRSQMSVQRLKCATLMRFLKDFTGQKVEGVLFKGESDKQNTPSIHMRTHVLCPNGAYHPAARSFISITPHSPKSPHNTDDACFTHIVSHPLKPLYLSHGWRVTPVRASARRGWLTVHPPAEDPQSPALNSR